MKRHQSYVHLRPGDFAICLDRHVVRREDHISYGLEELVWRSSQSKIVEIHFVERVTAKQFCGYKCSGGDIKSSETKSEHRHWVLAAAPSYGAAEALRQKLISIVSEGHRRADFISDELTRVINRQTLQRLEGALPHLFGRDQVEADLASNPEPWDLSGATGKQLEDAVIPVLHLVESISSEIRRRFPRD